MFDNYEIINYENEVNKIEQLTKNYTKKPIQLNKLKVGQIITINFYPNSQKYIYILTPKFGEIVEVSETANVFDYKFLSYTSESQQIELLFHLGVSYYGTSLDYDYYINEVESYPTK
jgi:hypothetical protein